jgi:predicted nucleic acid-binding protein
MTTDRKIVIDANLALALTIPLPYSPQAVVKINHWQQTGTSLFVPTLWIYEVMSGMRKSVVAKVVSAEQAEQALDLIFALPIEPVPPMLQTCSNIFHWAIRLNHSQVYDATYLALAEQLDADFWTADKRLVNRAKQLNLSWVYLVD